MTTTPSQQHHRRPWVGTIVWGAILAGIAVFAVIAMSGVTLSTTAVLWSVAGFGALLLLAAIVTAIVRAATAATREHPPIG